MSTRKLDKFRLDKKKVDKSNKIQKEDFEVAYKYKGISSDGKPVIDVITGMDLSDAKRKLKHKGVTIINISKNHSFFEKLGGAKVHKLDLKTVALFCSQLHSIISSGVNVLTGVHILSKMTKNKDLKKVLLIINGEIQKGKSISIAMESKKTGLPFLLVNMIEVGEVSGNLEDILQDMATYYEKEAMTRAKVKGAMTYPIILLVVGAGLVLFFMNFVLPEIMGIINDTGAQLPMITRVVLKVIDIIKIFGLPVAGALVGIFFASKIFIPKEKSRRFIDTVLLKIPLVKDMIRNVVTARFLRTTSLMIKSGIPIPEILDTVEKTMGNSLAEETIRKAKDGINKGEKLSENLIKSNFFEPMVVELISVGEETGQLESILINLTKFVDKESDASIARMLSAIEPLFTIVIGLVLATLVVSMLLPMFSMVSNLKK